MANIKFWTLFALFFVFSAQAEELPLDENSWAEATKGVSFVEKAPSESPKLSFPNFTFSLNEVIIQYIVFALIFATLLYFLLRYLRSLQSLATTDESIKIEVNSLQEAEENPMQADLKKLISKLIAQNKFREATRAYFLLVLQHLYMQKLISWQKQKTNFDYVGEVQNSQFYSSFRSLTTTYERIWYGKQVLSEEDFIVLEPAFAQLLKSISDEKQT